MDLPDTPPAPVDGIRVGVGGWTFAPWRDNFYPRGLVQRRELEYASRQLNTLEVNGTFYRAQSPATYARWRDETPPGFVFSVKAPMRIVQARDLGATGGQVQAFVGGLAELGDRLGPVLWQFERPLPHDALAAFLALLPRQAGGHALRHAIEVRDAGSVDAGLVALARAHGVATVYTDAADHPSFADVTAGFVYARLMRAQPGLATGYRTAQLRQWARRARQWAAGGAPENLPCLAPAPPDAPAAAPREVYVYFINAAKERNPAAAMALLRILRG